MKRFFTSKTILFILILVLIASTVLFVGCAGGNGPAKTTPADNGKEDETPHEHDFADATCTAAKTCKRCGATEGEALKHDFADATCTAAKTCKRCGATEGEALKHDFADATCTTPKTCKRCGATEGEALAHDFADATCTAPKTCKICGATDGDALGHSWMEANCTSPKTCTRCHATEGEPALHRYETDVTAPTCTEEGYTTYLCPACGDKYVGDEVSALGHDWADATLTAPKTCKRCGATEGDVLTHDWANATCTTPKTCKTCGATDGDALGHDFADATCTTAKTCKRCGATDGDALGHDFADATCTTPKTCKRCGVTDGDALGHDFADATCTTAKTCKTCGAIEGNALSHHWKSATCTEPKTCKTCGATDGSPSGHYWIEATTQAPKTCAKCGATVGAVLEKIIPDDKNLILGLEKIPIANSDMTEDELRDLVVSFMKLQINFAYTPDFGEATDSYGYYIKNLYSAYNGKSNLDNLKIMFYEGKYYGGVPYMGNAAGNLYRWLPFYNADTGVMDWTPIINSRRAPWTDSSTSRVYPDVGSNLFGNSCSSACFWAYSRISDKINSCWTAGWLPKNNFVKVGEYTLADNDTGHGSNTENVCTSNGTEVMYKAYACVKRADGFVHTGHAAMAVADAVVVYNQDGSINGEKSYVLIAEQKASFLTAAPSKGGTDLYSPLNDKGVTYRIMGNYAGNNVCGKIKEMKWTFNYLYTNGYLPFTAPELAGTDPVDKATVTFTSTGSTITVADISKKTITSNYCISDVHFTVKDSKGNETYIGMFAKNVTSPAAMKTYTLSTAMTNNIIYSSKDYLKTELSKYTDGSYTLVISARVSTGELITVYTGTLTK